MTMKEKRSNPLYINGINFDGNLKLKNTDEVRFMIWNIPAVVTCPYRTASCEKFCYARKAERMYPSCNDARQRNLEVSKDANFAERMIYTIETEMNAKKFAGKKIVFRIHESGDFYNTEYFEKWIQIARHFENNRNIVFLAYTKSIIYAINNGYGIPDHFPANLVIRSSIWADTRKDLVELTESYNIPVYTALSAHDMDVAEKNGLQFEKCRCEDCATCGKCWDKSIQTIITYIH